MCARKKKPRLEDFLTININENFPYKFAAGAKKRMVQFLYSEAEKLIKTSQDIEEGERADNAEEFVTETILDRAIRKETIYRPDKNRIKKDIFDGLIQIAMLFLGENLDKYVEEDLNKMWITIALVVAICVLFVFKTGLQKHL